MSNLCVIQARMGSTRLPGKILKEISGMPSLEYQVNRIKQAKKVDKIVIATTTDKSDDPVEKLCKKINIDCFRGSTDDVLDRYYQCVQKYPEYENIIRLTGDCPLTDPKVIDQVIDLFESGDYDYANNVQPDTFPDGMDVEVFKRGAIEISAKESTTEFEHEHMNEYVLNSNEFKKGNLKAEHDYSKYRLTVDNQEDYEVVKFLAEHCPADAAYLDYIEMLEKNPAVIKLNAHIKRNEYAYKKLKNYEKI
ncbi:glycosyltransferase family protein [Candidatus Falkowbacteria bacterium]|nr:glycosyltransferase family protein [Candidatus Falkowbacteria bacterium]